MQPTWMPQQTLGQNICIHQRRLATLTAYGGKTIEAFRRADWNLLQDSPLKPFELYDLKSDPQETTELAAKNPRMLNELAVVLRQHIQRGGATPWQKPPPGGST